MFYTYDDILAALKNGTDPGEIAQAFTNDLNKAIQESEGPTAYQEAVAKLAEAWHDVVDAYDDEFDAGFDVSELYLAPSEIEEAMPTAMKLISLGINYSREFNRIVNPSKDYSDESFEDVVADFLNG